MSAFHRLRTFLHSLHGGLLRKNVGGHKDTNGSRSNGQPTKTFHTGEGGVVCELCHHEAALNVDGYGEAVPVPAFGPRMVCTACEIIGAHARPNCQERQMQESTACDSVKRCMGDQQFDLAEITALKSHHLR